MWTQRPCFWTSAAFCPARSRTSRPGVSSNSKAPPAWRPRRSRIGLGRTTRPSISCAPSRALRGFDPPRSEARLETGMWRSYHDQRKLALFTGLATVFARNTANPGRARTSPPIAPPTPRASSRRDRAAPIKRERCLVCALTTGRFCRPAPMRCAWAPRAADGAGSASYSMDRGPRSAGRSFHRDVM